MMNSAYENQRENTVFVEPVKVEDAPLPLFFRVWEAVKRGAFGLKRRIRRSGALKKAVWAMAALMLVAAAPVLLLFLLLNSTAKAGHRTGAAY